MDIYRKFFSFKIQYVKSFQFETFNNLLFEKKKTFWSNVQFVHLYFETPVYCKNWKKKCLYKSFRTLPYYHNVNNKFQVSRPTSTFSNGTLCIYCYIFGQCFLRITYGFAMSVSYIKGDMDNRNLKQNRENFCFK